MVVRMKIRTRHEAQTVVTTEMGTFTLFFQEFFSWDVGSGPEHQIVSRRFCGGLVAWESI